MGTGPPAKYDLANIFPPVHKSAWGQGLEARDFGDE
jgi:hypothetical protein